MKLFQISRNVVMFFIVLFSISIIASATTNKAPTKIITKSSINKAAVEELQKKLNQIDNINLSSAKLAGEQINWQVISSGGTDGSSTSYKLLGTIGQTAIGTGSSTNFTVNHGYWQTITSSSGGCCDLSGDANDDGELGISDLTFFVDYMFVPGSPAPVCFEEFDNNSDCELGISDLTFFVDFMFVPGSPVPPPCHVCP